MQELLFQVLRRQSYVDLGVGLFLRGGRLGVVLLEVLVGHEHPLGHCAGWTALDGAGGRLATARRVQLGEVGGREQRRLVAGGDVGVGPGGALVLRERGVRLAAVAVRDVGWLEDTVADLALVQRLNHLGLRRLILLACCKWQLVAP